MATTARRCREIAADDHSPSLFVKWRMGVCPRYCTIRAVTSKPFACTGMRRDEKTKRTADKLSEKLLESAPPQILGGPLHEFK
ncbi:hypothetical protein NDU88_001265 [Pleurodeles waltl]|uniref:Uncharacterized protein n=1 Tax=Pleurodeles waltl TaxID=8319 RepID=A0AAV7KP07_PLEWA|nr:hypothetical protein NDU88_001265 [Pleurodeles waltl]